MTWHKVSVEGNQRKKEREQTGVTWNFVLWHNLSQRECVGGSVTGSKDKRTLCKSDMYMQIDTLPQQDQLRGYAERQNCKQHVFQRTYTLVALINSWFDDSHCFTNSLSCSVRFRSNRTPWYWCPSATASPHLDLLVLPIHFASRRAPCSPARVSS